MICERCNQKQVALLYRESAGGRVRAMRLCHECAEILEQTGELEEVSAAVTGTASPRFLADECSYLLPFHGMMRREDPGDSPSCPVCGATMGDISAAGRVGCATCYTVFSEELARVIRSAHGRAEHTGRTSAGYRARLEKAERLAGLKKQLREAISKENYETAVGLRDTSRGLEAEL